MVRRLFFVVAFGSAVPVLAQSTPGAGEIIIDSTGPEAHYGESTRVPLPPAGPERDAFLEDFLRVNPRDNEVSMARRSLSAFEFYSRINRPDLAARADERTRQRIWLFSGSVVTLVAGVVGGVVVLSNAQNLNDPRCFAAGNVSYNDCVDRYQQTTLIGGLIIGAGVVLAGGLLTWGLLTPEMVTTPEETVRLATEYNRDLARKHGATEARLQLLPALAPGYAGLMARLSF